MNCKTIIEYREFIRVKFEVSKISLTLIIIHVAEKLKTVLFNFHNMNVRTNNICDASADQRLYSKSL